MRKLRACKDACTSWIDQPVTARLEVKIAIH